MNNLYMTLSIISLALVPALASAEPSEPVSFRHSGVNYTYTSEQIGDRKVLRGVAGPSHEPFVLNVGKNWVDGTVNGSAVSFSLKSVKRMEGIVTIDQLAAR